MVIAAVGCLHWMADGVRCMWKGWGRRAGDGHCGDFDLHFPLIYGLWKSVDDLVVVTSTWTFPLSTAWNTYLISVRASRMYWGSVTLSSRTSRRSSLARRSATLSVVHFEVVYHPRIQRGQQAHSTLSGWHKIPIHCCWVLNVGDDWKRISLDLYSWHIKFSGMEDSPW